MQAKITLARANGSTKSASRRKSEGAGESDGEQDLRGSGGAVEAEPGTGHARNCECPTCEAGKGRLTCGNAYFTGSF